MHAWIEALEARTLFSTTVSIPFDPKNFDRHQIDNAYMPWIPGTTYLYKGTVDGEPETDRVTVIHGTRKIAGVTTTVVIDLGYVDGELVEKTFDFYAQDKSGNVWYFGEKAQQFENGKLVGTEGSWRAGQNGAVAGIAMLAKPEVDDDFAQEDAPGIAEDRSSILSVDAKAKTACRTFSHTVETKDYSPIEPGAVEHKFFAKGIGFVRSETVSGDEQEVLVLSKIIHGN